MPGLPPHLAAGGPVPSPLLSPSALEMWDSLDAVVYVADMQTHEVLFANREARAALGGDPVGRLCWQAIQSGQSGPCPFCTNPRLVDARGEPAGPLRWEFQNTRNGRWYAIVDQALRWRDGRLVRLEIATDITGVKERKAAQEQAQNRLKRLVEHAGDAYFLADANGNILDVNLAAERSLGYGRDELLRLMVTDIEVGFPGLDNAEVVRSLPLDQTTTLEGAHRRKDGSVFPVELCLCPFLEEGRLLLLALARDISVRRHREQDLRQSEELYRSLFTEALDMLVVADPETGRILDCNRAALTAFGYTREEMLGMRQQDLHPESWRAGGFSREFREHATSRLGEVIEAPIVTRAGEQRTARIKTGLFPAGARTYALGIFADITESKRAEEREREHLAFLQSLGRIDLALRQHIDLDQALPAALEEVLDIFGADRAWLLHPCDPAAPAFRVPFEASRPEYPGALAAGQDVPTAPCDAEVFRAVLAAEEPLVYGPGGDGPLESAAAEKFRVRAQMLLALRPRLGRPWLFGLHQCSGPRTWTAQERRLFQEIGRRLADGLTSLRYFRELRAGRDRLEAVVEATTGGIWTWNFPNNTLEFSPKFYAMLGYEPGEFPATYESWVGLLHPDDRERARAVFEQWAQAGQGAYSSEFRLRTKSGGYCWVHSTARVAERNEGGEPVLMIGNHQDVTERRQHEEELREKEARFRALFNATSDSVVLLAPDGEVLDLNENAARRRDMDTTAMRGQKIYALLPAAAAALRREAVARVLAEGRLEQYEEVRDGRHYRIRIFPVFDEAGLVFQLASFSRDVTEQTLAEKGLRESEERNRLIVETAREGVWAMDAQFRTTFVNQSMTRMLGHAESEMLGRPVSSFMFGEDLRELGKVMKARGKGMDGQYERRFRRRDGSEVWTLVSATALKDSEGRFCGSFGMFTDITGRKRDEKALAQYRLALESAEDMVAVLDSGRRYTMVNEAYLRMVGRPRDQVLGRHARVVLGPEAYAADQPRLDAALAGIPARFETRRDTPAGPRMLQASYFPVTLAGREVRVAAVIHDITEQHAHEAALLAAKEAAEAASRAKSEFLATMSHEIRTPLNGVMGMLQLLQGAGLGEEEEGFVEVALESSRSLLRILSDILDMSRIEAGTMDIAAEEFTPAEVVEPVFVAFRDEAARKGLAYSRDLDPGLPERLVADPVRIRQVLFNLMGNAVKYTQAGEVRMEAYPLPHPRDPGGLMLHFVVADTGMGIPDGRLNQMFEPFTQLDGTSTRHFGGAGLGLAIVKRLVRLMGGTLAVDTEPGRGTEMHLSLPVRAAGRAAAPERPAAGPAQGLRVLVVEDDRINLMAALHMLRRLGHAAEGAGEGGEALEKLRQGPFDCVLMDIQMPGLDGVAATRRIRGGEAGEAVRNVPIIALTAHAMAGDRENFLAAGMDGYLAKPMDMGELRAVLARSTGQPPGTGDA